MASTVLTLVGFVPCSVHLLRRPSMASFVYSLVITALSFFQFSFHVHEKTILLAVVPACLLLAFLVNPGIPDPGRKCIPILIQHSHSQSGSD